MKNNLLTMIFCLFAIQGFGQTETLFHDAQLYGGFGGPIIEFSQFKGDMVTSIGGGGGIFIDDFFLGGYGMGTIEMEDPSIDLENYRMKLGHGGIWLGYMHRPTKLVHAFASAKVGWGGIDVEFRGAGERPSDNVFVLQPEAGVEVNLFRWFKLVGTVGYRSVSGVNRIETHTNSDFSGLTGGLTFRFGWFED